MKFQTQAECQAEAIAKNKMFYSYNPRNHKCAIRNRCFYNTRTAPPNSRWYLNSQEWRSFKAPNSQEDISQFASIASGGFLSPDPDYVEDGEDEIYSLELSGASPSHRFGFEHICVAIVCILLGPALF